MEMRSIGAVECARATLRAIRNIVSLDEPMLPIE